MSHSAENDVPLPEVDRGALVMADLAWVETEGSPADRTKAAIRAYLWAVQVTEVDGRGPSLNMWREAARERNADDA